jgi:hypothetical protein
MPSPMFRSILVAAGCTLGMLSYEASAFAQTQTFSTRSSRRPTIAPIQFPVPSTGPGSLPGVVLPVSPVLK